MRRLLLIWCLLLAGIGCISQSEAFWQSRDSNYNKKISTGVAPTGTAPTLDGTPITFPFASTATLTNIAVNYTSSQTNDIIVVAVFDNQTTTTAPTITSMTGGGDFALTWSNLDNNSNAMTAQAAPNGGGVDPSVRVSYFWAHASTTVSSNTISLTFSSAVDNGTLIISAWHGCGNTSAPWDVNGSLPASASAAGASVATTSATTTAPGTVILSHSGSAKTTNSNVTQTFGAGFTLVAAQNEAGGNDFTWSGMQYKALTTAQTISVPFGQSWFNWVAMTHALVGT